MHLLAIAFIEGFATLAVEIYAVRATANVVGSSVTSTGILLGAILLALSLGYYFGGRRASRLSAEQIMPLVALRLAQAAALYGMVLPLHETVLRLAFWTTQSLPLGVGLVSLLYVWPVLLASQVLPLMAQLRGNGSDAGASAGLFLAVSTVGSVVGVIVPPLLLFGSIGLAATSALIILMLTITAVAVAWIHRRPEGGETVSRLEISVLLLIAAVGSAWLIERSLAETHRFDTAYQTLVIRDSQRDGREVRSMGSGPVNHTSVYADTLMPSMEYQKAVLEVIPPNVQSAVVFGAAGFAVPEALVARGISVTALDLDPAVRRVAEAELRRRPLSPQIEFLDQDARLFSRWSDRRFDVAIMDAFFGVHPPPHLFTVEALRELSGRAAFVAANVILDAGMASTYARRILSTWHAAFPAGEAVLVPLLGGGPVINAILCSTPCSGIQISDFAGPRPYTDDRNGMERDAEVLLTAMLTYRR